MRYKLHYVCKTSQFKMWIIKQTLFIFSSIEFLVFTINNYTKYMKFLYQRHL